MIYEDSTASYKAKLSQKPTHVIQMELTKVFKQNTHTLSTAKTTSAYKM